MSRPSRSARAREKREARMMRQGSFRPLSCAACGKEGGDMIFRDGEMTCEACVDRIAAWSDETGWDDDGR